MRKLKLKIKGALGITTIQENQLLFDKKLSETNWAMVLDFAIRDSDWFKKQSLNPGRWAMGFPALYILFRVLNDIKPKNILEFGLGESTKLTFQYHQHFSLTKLTVVEHNEEWVEFFSNEVYNIRNNVQVLPVTKKLINGFECNAYENLMTKLSGNLYDLVVIDGPIGTLNYSRYQMAEIIENDLLAESFVILLDDANRPGEKQTIAAACKLLESKNIKYRTGIYSGEKEMQLICSENYGFLATL